MSVFGNILEKLGLRKSSNASRPTTTQQRKPQQSAQQGSAPPGGSTAPHGSAGGGSASQASQVPGTTGTSRTTASSSSGATATASQQPVAMVDVTAHLEELAAENRQQLNWRTSIVDLLKLLDIDSSPAARKERADELGAPLELKHGSAELNTWLHRTVLRKIAENGGNVPRELLD